jgi:uncharacterized protein
MERLVVWRGLDDWRAEAAHVRVDGDRLNATGTQLGVTPEPYRLDYSLRTGPGFVTERLELSVLRSGALKRLLVVRRPDGTWTADDRVLTDVEGALDCDLQNSPLTNTMPVLREDLLASGAQPRDFVMAWVAVPDLTVHRSEQRYEPLDERRVRYVGLGTDFTADLELDDDGLVVRYPQLGERVQPSRGLTPLA